MHKITYLFGAGASKNALPIVKEFPERIQNLIDFLEKDNIEFDESETFDDLGPTVRNTKNDYYIEMIGSLKWMLKVIENHSSVDTFAKKLYIKGLNSELNRLKIALSVFFMIEQTRCPPDIRYDGFFASLIEGLNLFPHNVNILSWNYDYQFEMAYSDYSGDNDLYSNRSDLRINTKYGDKDFTEGFCIFKLNGTAGFYFKEEYKEYMNNYSIKDSFSKYLLDKILKTYVAATYRYEIVPMLSFAWESERPLIGILDLAIENTKYTDILVVIGYSFPFFNREIDRRIIRNMENLKKVYFQAPDAENLKERFQAIRDDLNDKSLITKYDKEQFLIPNEL